MDRRMGRGISRFESVNYGKGRAGLYGGEQRDSAQIFRKIWEKWLAPAAVKVVVLFD